MFLLLRSKGDLSPLRAHAAACATCGETLAVAPWMHEMAAMPIAAPPDMNPTRMWLKAEVLRRWDVEGQVQRSLDIGEHVQAGVGLAGAAIMLAWLWNQVRQPVGPSS